VQFEVLRISVPELRLIYLLLRIMPSSGMLRRVALVRTDVSEELRFSIIRVTRIGELGTTLAVTGNRCTLRRNISQKKAFHSHRSENLKSDIFAFNFN
jgi:hypothetical protein